MNFWALLLLLMSDVDAVTTSPNWDQGTVNLIMLINESGRNR